MDTRTYVEGSGGARLALREVGPAGAPAVVLVHGWAQSAESWRAQLDDPALAGEFRLVAVDLRGHGDSDAPADGYADPRVWADDLAAVLAHVGAPSVLVGWSYGGLVIADYLRAHGSASVAGLAFVGAITEIGRGRRGGAVGATMRAALPAALSEDFAVAVPALSSFFSDLGPEVPGETRQRLFAAALRTPPRVRAALFRRTQDSADVLAAVDVPTLVLHGRADTVVDPSCAEFAAERVPGAELSWWDGVGHAPFAERPAAFAAELAGFARRCLAGAAR
ncbi:Lysophospholipase, alpha-beta hydrolase superfamily [Streptoalloteichus tenebrarius]|uniref:Lysophospholipase, alpha-beta hydrolase superfamily n=1 Tax=Streptoalloteichus tenebrarius (strain ATCC 17920 / DSM 40477 / JCM 4838 / CBS 697.72 / NBRC 16177 / NCIMB 11028 / NRRL B-12390 / A12253. 1 / ISP 5477) TaxID=1933 RepID=A0ABT1I1N1_STRSD|nr:alpha/beta fold hydrolase [Streptoalloteichus tenebrarius]MCP2261697.1 Lysophospholipase, alpha-beta hydrolase superfamily [Streptoalloteichus tenebrarius]BFF02408.1 alpha/beta hydrolase [Streptoalloteichus tenebrarius]